MPTASERQALLFLAAVALVGGGARFLTARRFEQEVAAGERGSARSLRDGAIPVRNGDPMAARLAQQLAAVDSAQAERAATRKAPRKGRARAPAPSTSGIFPGGPSSDRRQEPTLSPEGNRSTRTPFGPIDVNRATAEELERLPRVGPALAKRIVEWRDANGPFESVESLRHVRGIGVTTAAMLAPLVTFSSGHRPFRSETRPSRRDPVPPVT